MTPELLTAGIANANLGEGSSGCHATYIKLNDKYGFKYFSSETIARKSHAAQLIAYENGIGPEIGDIVSFNNGFCTCYGYLTGHVATVAYDVFDDLYTYQEDAKEDTELYYYVNRGMSEYIKRLGRKMRSLGLDTDDLHYGNWGWDANGNLMCFDFSFQDYEEEEKEYS